MCESIIGRLKRERSLLARIELCRAMFRKGFALGQLDRNEEAIDVYQAVIDTFGEEERDEIRLQVAMATFNKGVRLGRLDRHEDALDACQAVIDAFGEENSDEIRLQVAKAMLNKGATFGQLDRHEDALDACQAVIDTFGKEKSEEIRLRVVWAMFDKGVTLGQLDRHEDAIDAYQAVIDTFCDEKRNEFRGIVAKAMWCKGKHLAGNGQLREAIEVYDGCVERFGNETSGVMMLVAADAREFRYLILRELEEPEADDAWQEAHARAEGDQRLRLFRRRLVDRIPKVDMDGYKEKMDEQELGTKRFFTESSCFARERSFLMVLREWNSYTPAVPVEGEHDRGGGYYLQHGGEGIAIDPGYDFLQNFRQAGGRLADIRHIILTHAHDDHTAQFESLLMLLHKRSEEAKLPTPFRPVRVYLSEGCGRKFSGLLPLKGDKRIERVVSLVHGGRQVVKLNGQTTLTVLPAYHNDVITHDTAVGLGFAFKLAKGEKRRIVFTSDTGYYPQRTKKGDGKGKEAAVVAKEDAGLWHRYPRLFQHPDLLVAHMGSIAKEEFKGWKEALKELSDLTGDEPRDEGRYYYPNHLGLLGMLTLLDHMQPPAAIISEFGSELRGFHIELVEKLGEVFREKQEAEEKPGRSFIVPGDLTMVYYLDKDTFLCHEEGGEKKADELRCVKLPEWRVWRPLETASDQINAEPTKTERAHLCCKENKSDDAAKTHGYYVKRFLQEDLPHFERKSGSVVGTP